MEKASEGKKLLFLDPCPVLSRFSTVNILPLILLQIEQNISTRSSGILLLVLAAATTRNGNMGIGLTMTAYAIYIHILEYIE